MTNRVDIQYIEIQRGEGPNEESGKRFAADSPEAINRELANWSKTAPKGGAYDKCDFWIVFRDGAQYTGRYDLKHESELQEEGTSRPDILKRVRDHLETTAGWTRPAWMDDAQWERFQATNARFGFDQQAFDFLAKYNIDA